MKIAIIVGILVIAGVLIWGFATKWGKSYSTSNPSTQASTVSVTDKVVMKNLSFQPITIQVAPGTTVTWTNEDSTNHTVTSDTGKFNSEQLSNGKTFQFTFSDPGEYTYHCSIHPSMTGKVIVK